MSRSKNFWILLWFLITSGGFLSGYSIGKFGGLLPSSELLIITEHPEFIDPAFQIYFYEKHKVKILVRPGSFEEHKDRLHFTTLDKTPLNQTPTELAFNAKKISPQFSQFLQNYPQFFPLFWRVSGESPQFELTLLGLWVPENLSGQELSLLLKEENLQEWINSSKENLTLNPDIFTIQESRSPIKIRDYPFSQLKLLKPKNEADPH